MPKCPPSSGPVRKELGCWTDIDFLSAIRSLARAARGCPLRIEARRHPRIGLARGPDEGADLVGILLAGGMLDPRGDVEAVRPCDAQRLGDIAGVEAARQHERYGEIEILEQVPIEGLAVTARTAALTRRP